MPLFDELNSSSRDNFWQKYSAQIHDLLDEANKDVFGGKYLVDDDVSISDSYESRNLARMVLTPNAALKECRRFTSGIYIFVSPFPGKFRSISTQGEKFHWRDFSPNVLVKGIKEALRLHLYGA